jgi:geranylgeranyl diphosphate synthase type I
MSSDEKTLGKDIGNDIRNGKKTLIAVHALQHATGKQKKLLDAVFGNRNASDMDVKNVFTLFKEIGSIEYARTTALAYTKQAKEKCQVLRSSPAKDLLCALVEYSITREK